MSLQEFLRHVLPDEGLKCWFSAKKEHPVQQGFTASFDDLAQILLSVDGSQWNAYFACSSFKVAGSRKAENVQAVRSFWLDLDAGPYKDYPDAETAVQALDAFCDAIGLPYPTLVYSGYGAHCYWSMDKAVSPEIWAAAAKGLKSLVAKHGLMVDPSRTADIASILRPPSTYNWKNPAEPKAVEVVELMPHIDQQWLVSFLSQDIKPVNKPQHRTASNSLNAAVANIYQHSEPSYGQVASDSCAQLKLFRDSKGNIPEPLWYAGLGVLAHCEDGEPLAHNWSSGHPAYTAEETARKLTQARTASGPTTCSKFKALNPATCQGCPFAITSPIVLGRQARMISPTQQTVEQLPQLPDGFAWGSNRQLMAIVDAEDGTRKYRVISSTPVYVADFCYGEAARCATIRFRMWDKHNQWHEFETPAATLKGQGFFSFIAGEGVMLGRGVEKIFEDFIIKSIDVFMNGMKGNAMRYDQFGWKEEHNAFVAGNFIYRKGGTMQPARVSSRAHSAAMGMMAPKGASLQGWANAAQRVFVPGMEAMAFGLLSAFGAPLIGFISGEQDGGSILSLVSGKGGVGKTTLLSMIASAWGEYESLTLIKTDTTVSKFATITTANNLPIGYDEFRDDEYDGVRNFTEWFTEGRDRKRANIKGEVEKIPLHWKTIMTSTSNFSVVDAINKKYYDPMSTRVLELYVKKPDKLDLGNEWFMPFKENRALAGPAFIQYLLSGDNLDSMRSFLKKAVNHYAEVINAEGDMRFIARLLAANSAAGLFLNKLGLLKFDHVALMNYAINAAKRRSMESRDQDPVVTLSTILTRHAPASCLVVKDKFHPRQPTFVKRVPNRDCQMRYEIDPQRVYVSVSAMKTWSAECGVAYSELTQQLLEKKILLSIGRMTSLGAGTDLALGRTLCWELDYSHPAMGEIGLKEVIADAANIG